MKRVKNVENDEVVDDVKKTDEVVRFVKRKKRLLDEERRGQPP